MGYIDITIRANGGEGAYIPPIDPPPVTPLTYPPYRPHIGRLELFTKIFWGIFWI